MTYAEMVEFAANVGAIVTGISSFAIAASLAGRRLGEKWALEAYLKRMTTERRGKDGQGLENILEVMRQTKLGEEAVMRAAFSSKHVRVRSRVDDKSHTKELVLGYGDHGKD